MRKWLLYILIILSSLSTAWAEDAPNRVLSLDGYGDYVEMADSEALNDIGSQVTIEAWVKVTEFTDHHMPIVCKGDMRVPDLSNISFACLVQCVLNMVSGRRSQAQICREHNISESSLSRWRQQFIEEAPKIFENGASARVSRFRVQEGQASK